MGAREGALPWVATGSLPAPSARVVASCEHELLHSASNMCPLFYTPRQESALGVGVLVCPASARHQMYEDGPRHGSSEEEDDVAYLAPPCPISPGLRAQTLKCVNTLSGHHSGIRVIAMATNRVYTGSYDNTIKVWNLDNGRCEATLEGHVAWIRSLFVHAREPLLFSGSDDGIIKIWSLDTYVQLYDILPADGDRSQTGVLALTVDYDHNWCAPPPPSVRVTARPHPPAARACRARTRAPRAR